MAMAVLSTERPARAPRGGSVLRGLLFVLIGALLGYAYHRLVGCRTGTCPITANPYVSTAYGALVGFLASGGLR